MKKRLFPLILMVWTVLGIASPIQDRVEIISLPKTAAVREAAAKLHLDLLTEKDGRIFVVAPPSDLQKIVGAGLSYRLETRSFAPATPEANEAA